MNKINPIQAMMDGISAHWQKERASSQLTVGEAIKVLRSIPNDTAIVPGISYPHSYRGYYSDLAFEPAGESITAGELLGMFLSVMGKSLVGYKGGNFIMGETTPVWVAHYGACGDRLMAIGEDGSIVTAPEED